MSSLRKNRLAFRPSLTGLSLEDRVVLNGAGAQIAATQGGMTIQQVRQAFRNQFQTAANDLRQFTNSQISTLFANGTPTQQQFADLRAQLNGALDANAFRLSSSAALLPTGTQRLVVQLQRNLLGDQRNGLIQQLNTIFQSSNRTSSAASLQRAVNNALQNVSIQNTNQLNNFFANTALNRNSVDANGDRIGLQQFISNQAITQFSNTFGSLAQSVPTIAGSTLFPNGTVTASAANLQTFANQLLPALNTAAFQLGSNLSLLPNAVNSVVPRLQTAFFDMNSGSNSLFNSIQSLPNTSTAFNTAATTAFNNGFQNIVTPVSNFLALPSTQTFSLPTNNFSNVFGVSASNFGGGFNTGFGTGFIGLGTPSSTFNSQFSTGFNGLISGTNTSIGFRPPFVR